jgi:hypothetical protein
MENNQGRDMRISWVLTNTTNINPAIDVEQLRNIGPFWGGWRTWRSYATDNVICHTESEAQALINKNFHTRCNLYVPLAIYTTIDRPANVKIYQGEFHEIVDDPDDIVSMHLAAAHSDIVLLVGVDLQPRDLGDDRLAKHKWHNYKQYILHIIKGNPDVQWVILDQLSEIDKDFDDLPNLLFDKLENVLTQFS